MYYLVIQSYACGMPRSFTAEESDRIRERLKEAGRESFARRGVRRTTVEELARAAAISKGAFYRFFDSKEALLLTLLNEYEISAHAAIEDAVRADPRHGIDVLVDTALSAVEQNPLLPVLMSEEGLRALHSLPPAEQEALLERDAQLVERVAGVLREAGIRLEVSETVLLGLLRSLVFVGRHRADIGTDLLDDVGLWIKANLRAALQPVAEQEAR